MSVESPSIRVSGDELRTVREAMRDLGALLDALEGGEVDKLVLTQRNRFRAVLVSVETWSELERALSGGVSEPATQRFAGLDAVGSSAPAYLPSGDAAG